MRLRLAGLPVLMLLAAGCGGFQPDMTQIEADLAAEIGAQEDIDDLVVDCPSEIDWEPGGDFHCTVDGITIIQAGRVTVSMENDQGEYSWKIDE